MREELLNFYIGLKENDKIIQLCRENGEKESNLWYPINLNKKDIGPKVFFS